MSQASQVALFNPSNKNQRLIFSDLYLGTPIMQEKGPMVEEYLQALASVVNQATRQYRSVFAIRFDLRFPRWMQVSDEVTDNRFIVRFIESFKAKIKHNRKMVCLESGYAHDCKVRYVWAREVGYDDRVHYHVALLLNRDAFFTLGRFNSEEPNTANRVTEAWASALGLPPEQARGLIHFPENASYRLEASSPDSLSTFFYRASYLCKVDTKMFGFGHHGFGCSRI